jgi:Ser/Thr protein kinase RdoA (MazF antagonist)
LFHNYRRIIFWRGLKSKKNLEIYGVIHNDFRAQNLLQKDNKILAILDFDWSCYGCFKKDLAQALTKWSLPDKAKTYWKDIFILFLDAYEKKGILNSIKRSLNPVCIINFYFLKICLCNYER